jgi:hypothetical protein
MSDGYRGISDHADTRCGRFAATKTASPATRSLTDFSVRYRCQNGQKQKYFKTSSREVVPSTDSREPDLILNLYKLSTSQHRQIGPEGGHSTFFRNAGTYYEADQRHNPA